MAKNNNGTINHMEDDSKNNRANNDSSNNNTSKKMKKLSKWQEFKITAAANLQEMKNKFKGKNRLEKLGYVAAGAAIPLAAAGVVELVQLAQEPSVYNYNDETIYSEYFQVNEVGSAITVPMDIKSVKDAVDVFEKDKAASNYMNDLYSANFKEINDFKDRNLLLIDAKYQKIYCPPMIYQGGATATTEGFCSLLEGYIVKVNILIEQEKEIVETMQIRENSGLDCKEQKQKLESVSEEIRENVGYACGFINRIKEVNKSHYFENVEEAESVFDSCLSRVKSIFKDESLNNKDILNIVSASDMRDGVVDAFSFKNGEELVEIINSHLHSLKENFEKMQLLMVNCDEYNFAGKRNALQDTFVLIENDLQILEACKFHVDRILSKETSMGR